MTKEELEKEAEGWLNKWELCNKCENKVDCISNFSYCKKVVLQSYLASAEPREKRITILEKRCANYEMTISKMEKGTCDICKEIEKDKKIAELKAQIEKMKCCANCKHSRTEYEHCRTNKHEKWEIKEND